MSITEKVDAAPDRLAETNETLLNAERQRSVGQSASAIAYDIDVAIAPITLYANALLEHESLSERARHYLASIRRAVDDVSQNVGRLRELDRPRDDQPGTVSRTQRPTVSVRSLRVLLIDDDPSLTEVLRTSLIEGQVTPRTAGSRASTLFRRPTAAACPSTSSSPTSPCRTSTGARWWQICVPSLPARQSSC